MTERYPLPANVAPRRPLPAKIYARHAVTYLELADEHSQPCRLERQEAAAKALRRAASQLEIEMQADR